MRKKAFKPVMVGVLLFCFQQIFAADTDCFPAATTFELVKGMIVVQAEVDGQAANFILDTGSPMMILNEKPTASADYQANCLQGGMAGTWKSINSFSWAGVQKYDLQALSADIGALEMVTNRPIAGLIGYEFLQDYELLIDFEKQLVTLAAQENCAKMEGWKLKSQLPFSLAGHLPVIEAKIGGVSLRLGLDTGANTNLLNLSKATMLDVKLVSPLNKANVVGMTAGESYKTYAVDIAETTIGGLNFRGMRFVFTDISHLQNLMNHQVDGLLGFPFFKSGKFSINYATQVISIWE